MTAQPSSKQIRDSFDQPTMWPPPKPVLAKAEPKQLKRAAA